MTVTLSRLAAEVASCLVLPLLIVVPATCQEPAEEIHFTQQLEMPVRGDTLRRPRSVVTDLHSGEVFVCDTLKHRIVIFDHRGLFRWEILGGSTFRAPLDLAVDPEGFIVLLPLSRSQIGFQLLDYDGTLLEEIPLTGLPDGADRPDLGSVALSPSGDRIYTIDRQNFSLWITDRKGVVQKAVDLAEGLSEEEKQELVLGRVDVYGNTVFVAVPTYGRIHMYDLHGTAQGVVGRKGTGSCNTAFPVAAALALDGTVFVLDKQRAMFMQWDPVTNTCLAEHSGFGNAPGAFYQPDDLALSSDARIYVSQGFEGRVQVFEGGPAAAGAPNSSPQEAETE